MEAQKIKDRQSILIKNNTAGGFQIMPWNCGNKPNMVLEQKQIQNE